MADGHSISDESPAKPSVFVGSSVEGLDVASAVQENLDYYAEVTVWPQGVFELTRPALSSLLKALNSFDFAIFVFTPDDILQIRNETVRAVRDNVVFELGLFMGELGEDRTFIIAPRGIEDLHLPSDLTGITPATYEPTRKDQNLTAALGVACTSIKRAMQRAGTRPPLITRQDDLSFQATSGLSTELRQELAQMLEEQETRIKESLNLFAERLMEMDTAQRSTAKAPITRTSNLLQYDLSPTAWALLFELMQGGSLTYEQYQTLRGSEYGQNLEELRHSNLIVPLTGVGDDDDKPSYWLQSDTYKAVRAATERIPPPEDSLLATVRSMLKRVGYLP